MNYISMVENTHRNHRSNIILHRSMWYFAEFDTVEQLDFFAQTLGFTYELRESRENQISGGTYQEYNIDRRIVDDTPGGFWKLEDIPEGAKPIKALSNGSIVTCYFTNDGETITFYRPNPNAKDVYKPLPIQEHIAHTRIYGTY